MGGYSVLLDFTGLFCSGYCLVQYVQWRIFSKAVAIRSHFCSFYAAGIRCRSSFFDKFVVNRARTLFLDHEIIIIHFSGDAFYGSTGIPSLK
jgi:hypothetical protein